MSATFHVRKHPSPQALYVARVALPDGADPEEWEQMTEEELKVWVDTEMAAGWQPEPLPPTPDLTLTTEDRLKALEEKQAVLRSEVDTLKAR